MLNQFVDDTKYLSLPYRSGAVRESSDTFIRVCTIMTSFNRRDKTMECLNALSKNETTYEIRLATILTDDGSTDGTSPSVETAFSWVHIIQGTGNLYWCRGMHNSFGLALKCNADFYLWLNDDTVLQQDALARLLQWESELRTSHGRPVIVVGSTNDPEFGGITYGGERQASLWRRTRFVKIIPSDKPQRCDSMNGNIVLISRAAAQIVGNLDPTFEHAMGDTDYALRARRLGVDVWVAPGVFGTCADNSPTGTFMDPSLPLSRRWKMMMGRKGLPWRSWLTLTRRHTGLLWPLYFVWPYVRLLTGRYTQRDHS